jgi:hypothetical protein
LYLSIDRKDNHVWRATLRIMALETSGSQDICVRKHQNLVRKGVFKWTLTQQALFSFCVAWCWLIPHCQRQEPESNTPKYWQGSATSIPRVIFLNPFGQPLGCPSLGIAFMAPCHLGHTSKRCMSFFLTACLTNNPIVI